MFENLVQHRVTVVLTSKDFADEKAEERTALFVERRLRRRGRIASVERVERIGELGTAPDYPTGT